MTGFEIAIVLFAVAGCIFIARYLRNQELKDVHEAADPWLESKSFPKRED